MSIESEMNRIEQNTNNALSAVVEYGVDVPSDANSDNLNELIRAIPKANIVQTTGDSTTDIMSQKAVTDALASLEQVQLEFVDSVEEMTDTSKFYVMDGFIYAYILTEVEAEPSYTNVLPLAINADGTPYVGTNGEKGYKAGWRLNSSAVEKETEDRCCTGFIAAKPSDTIRIKNMYHPTDNNMNGYLIIYSNEFVKIASGYEGTAFQFVNGACEFVVNNATMNSGTVADMAYFRISTGIIDGKSIVTINEAITEGGGTTTGYAWANTGRAFVPADYEDRIVDLENNVAVLKETVENISKEDAVDKIALIKAWDAPIYDDAPVFLLDEDKPAMGASTVAAVYAAYDALMAQHPDYITKTDLGLCSDGVTHIYRYDFCEPRTRNNPETKNPPELTKPKAIIVSGIHIEYAGIYALYHALEEIASNAKLYQSLRKNTHLIVIPALNPYCLDTANYDVSNGRKNANGVEIHRNFEIDHIVVDSSSNNYGGAEPLSEVESQCLDSVMAENPDAAFFLTCHNFDSDTYFGSGFIWPSVATNYMYNMGSRLIDKMSRAWLEKYGDTFRDGVDTVKTDTVEDGDYTIGMVGISNSPGTETKQALKYGIQGTNVEIAKIFSVFNSTIGSPAVMTHGAEVYINFLLTAFGVYDRKRQF